MSDMNSIDTPNNIRNDSIDIKTGENASTKEALERMKRLGEIAREKVEDEMTVAGQASERTGEDAEMEEAKLELMAGSLGVSVKSFGASEFDEFYRKAVASEITEANVGRVFEQIERPDQTYLREHPEAKELDAAKETLKNLSGNSERLRVLDWAANGMSDNKDKLGVTQFTVMRAIEDYPTAFAFEIGVASEIRESVNTISEKAIREYEEAVYGKEQVKYLDALDQIGEQVEKLSGKN